MDKQRYLFHHLSHDPRSIAAKFNVANFQIPLRDATLSSAISFNSCICYLIFPCTRSSRTVPKLLTSTSARDLVATPSSGKRSLTWKTAERPSKWFERFLWRLQQKSPALHLFFDCNVERRFEKHTKLLLSNFSQELKTLTYDVCSFRYPMWFQSLDVIAIIQCSSYFSV